MTLGKFAAPLAAAALLSACADQSHQIEAAYVSPLEYEDKSCAKLELEYARVGSRSREINSKQDNITENDSAATAVGAILFWPALFFIESDDHKEEVARLKGQIRAIEDVGVNKECTKLVTAIAADRKAADEARRRKEEAERRAQEAN
ncbi:MAG: hypothetical protein ACPGRZ_14555 [Alphaproteobacteria bacterium]